MNRIFDEDRAPPKPFGYIVDYCGVLRNLGRRTIGRAIIVIPQRNELARLEPLANLNYAHGLRSDRGGAA